MFFRYVLFHDLNERKLCLNLHLESSKILGLCCPFNLISGAVISFPLPLPDFLSWLHRYFIEKVRDAILRAVHPEFSSATVFKAYQTD